MKKGICSLISVVILFTLFSFTTTNNPALDANLFVDGSVQGIQPLIKFTNEDHPDVFHLFTQGKAGKLLIEGEWKDGVQLGEWLREVMPENIQHINIYGCNFARGQRGEAAVNYLEWVLGTTIAASDDITGIGGDWDLEIGSPIAALKLSEYEDDL